MYASQIWAEALQSLMVRYVHLPNVDVPLAVLAHAGSDICTLPDAEEKRPSSLDVAAVQRTD